ncbi:unnamed protein product [Lactuca saligna]|uniref:Uncharacterized protein n=1 Tax=Lactuca saligna TaxID=75948 RepID=A0AA35V3H7_LACSI|nr:unnamed protein product [Lactuca saligna]
MLYNLLIRDGHKYEPVVDHLKQMIISYIHEVGQMDVDIVAVLQRKPSVLPKDNLDGFDKLKHGKIPKDGWCVAFQLKEQIDAYFHKVCYLLDDKHLFSTSCMEYILDFVNKHKGNKKR